MTGVILAAVFFRRLFRFLACQNHAILVVILLGDKVRGRGGLRGERERFNTEIKRIYPPVTVTHYHTHTVTHTHTINILKVI